MKRFLSIALCLTVAPLLAQERFGALNGTVSDETGAVLPGVTVTLTHTSTHRVITAATRADGVYSVRNIDPGRYSVKFELARFATREFGEIDIPSGQTRKLDAKMTVGGGATTVQVIGAVPMIETETALVTHSVPQQELERLPKSRTFQYLAITAPGVNAGEIEGGIQVNGASSAENTFSIDGIATESAIDGRSRQNAPPEHLEEIQIKTAGIEAAYGGSLGGIISAVTKSGGDAFHGNAWFYYDGASLSASPERRLTLDPRDNRSVAYYQDEQGRNNQFEPGFSLGGPIRKDMLYFFTSWSSRWTRQEQTFRFGNGADTGVISRDRTFMSGFNKISFTPTRRIRTNLSWLWTPAK